MPSSRAARRAKGEATRSSRELSPVLIAMLKGYGMAHAPAMASRLPKEMSPGSAPGLGGRADAKAGDAALVFSLSPGVDSARLVLLHHLSMKVNIESFDFGSL